MYIYIYIYICVNTVIYMYVWFGSFNLETWRGSDVSTVGPMIAMVEFATPYHAMDKFATLIILWSYDRCYEPYHALGSWLVLWPLLHVGPSSILRPLSHSGPIVDFVTPFITRWAHDP